MRVPDPILTSAMFLCIKKDGVVTPAGTAFVLEMESDWPQASWHHRYLVTARYCIENAKRYGTLYARVNPFDAGKPILIEMSSTWEYHVSTEWRFYLLGLIRGHWEKEDGWLSDFGDTESETLNTGIAMVTPIQKALDIIDGSQELARDRKRRDKELATRDTGLAHDSAVAGDNPGLSASGT